MTAGVRKEREDVRTSILKGLQTRLVMVLAEKRKTFLLYSVFDS